MKIKFKDYTYFDPNSEDVNEYDLSTQSIEGSKVNNAEKLSEYAFDSNHYDKLIKDRRFQDAVDYARKYRFHDPNKQRIYTNNVYNLEREGRRLEAIYSRIDNEDTLNHIEFADNVFNDGGLEYISENPVAKQFVEYKHHLGSTKNNVHYRDATHLEITFRNKKQYLLGLDFLARDTSFSIEDFYEQSGLNETQLKSAGIEIVKRDGRTGFKFDKSNKLANKIIYNLPARIYENSNLSKYSDAVDVEGYFIEKGKPIYIRDLHNIIGEDNLGINYGYMSSMPDINYAGLIIKKAEEEKVKYFNSSTSTSKIYSSTIGPALDDGLDELRQSLANGAITTSEYNSIIKTEYGNLEEHVRALSVDNEMYTNAYNENEHDKTLIPADNIQRSNLVDLISATKPTSMHFHSMVVNGKVGTLISIDAIGAETKDLNKNSKPEDIAKNTRTQIFVPGLMANLAQEKINRHTNIRAIQELDNMSTWQYGYKCKDGQEFLADEEGNVFSNGELVSRQDAINAINKDMIIQDAVNNLQFEFMNKDGEIFDKAGYESMARRIAIYAADELNPDIPITNELGVPLSPNEIFARKGVGSTLAEEYARTTQFDVYKKYQEIFEIYDKIMNGLNYYR